LADAACILVITHTHGLVPLAHRLGLLSNGPAPERHELMVWVRGFRPAFQGAFLQLDEQVGNFPLDELLAEAERGDRVLVSDVRDLWVPSRGAQRRLARAPRRGQVDGSVRLGGWFEAADGEIHAPHLLVVEQGAWPGGIGPKVDAALMLGRFPHDQLVGGPLAPVWGELATELKDLGFSGLFQASVDLGGPKVQGFEAGWPWLHTHAFMEALSPAAPLDGVIRGEVKPSLGSRFTCVVPMSVPPWPSEGRAEAGCQIDYGEHQGRVFWHDIQVDREARRIVTGGRDGLIGVARGVADGSWETAVARAMGVVRGVSTPEIQVRWDAFQRLGGVLVALEEGLGLEPT